MYKDGAVKTLGIKFLEDDNYEIGEKFINALKEYGQFVVPYGELETWLPDLESVGHGPVWLIEKFKLMGSHQTDADYLFPGDNDVWNFIEDIKKWIDNPARKGMPE